MKREKAKLIIYDIHLYRNKIESLIKTLIWVISWVGGILAINDSVKGTAGAYFLFSLAMLMEFAEKIMQKKEWVAIFFHAIFCILNAILLIMAFCIFVLENVRIDIMFIISIFIVSYIILDCVLIWIIPEPLLQAPETDYEPQYQKTIDSFNESLNNGMLGSLK